MNPTDLSRFFNHVRVIEGCWLWEGALTHDGYGRFRLPHRTVVAHRWLYEQIVGPVVNQLDHLCRVRNCVNVLNHVEDVTAKLNIARGEGPAGINGRKTHCIRGHEFTPTNTYLVPKGRQCLACKSAWRRTKPQPKRERTDAMRAYDTAWHRRQRAKLKMVPS